MFSVAKGINDTENELSTSLLIKLERSKTRVDMGCIFIIFPKC